jgi:hypothetical protein
MVNDIELCLAFVLAELTAKAELLTAQVELSDQNVSTIVATLT